MDMANSPSLAEIGPLARASDAAESAKLRLLTPAQLREAAFLRDWRSLASRAVEPNPFFEPWFLLPSLTQFGAKNRIVIKAFFSEGRLRGLMPVDRASRYYDYPVAHASTWLHHNSFCGAPLVEAGYEEAFWRTLLAHFDARPGRALFLHLPEMPADGPVNAALERVLAEQGRVSAIVDQAERAMLACNASPEDYLSKSMSQKKRKELRRQRKRLGEEGHLLAERLTDNSHIHAWIEEFLALEAAGWKGGAGSALANCQATKAFFTQSMQSGSKAGRIERMALRLDGKAIAMLVNLVTPPGIFSFKTTFDESFARYSPGLLLQLENLELLGRTDVAWADSCAVEGHSMIERIWREKRRILARNIAIGGKLRRFAFSQLMAYENRGQGS